MRSLCAALALGLSACGCNSGGDDGGETDFDPCELDPSLCETGVHTAHTGGPVSNIFDPVAVGFEFDGIIRGNGEFDAVVLDDVQQEPLMLIQFVGQGFFVAQSLTEQNENSCVALGVFDPLPLPPPNEIDFMGMPLDSPIIPPTELYWSYEAVLRIDGHNCNGTGAIDGFGQPNPKVWGQDGSLLIDKFDGARFTIGFGPMTTFLEGAFPIQKELDELRPFLFAHYIGINDAEGDHLAWDWSSGLLFELAEAGGSAPVTDEDNTLQMIDVSGLRGGDPMPEGYIRSFAYWYQDFFRLDLDNLKDGAATTP